MPTTERCRVTPRDLRKQKLKEEIVRLRSAGCTYRQIGVRVGVSHVYAHRMLAEAYQEASERNTDDAAVALGLELDRLDSLIHAASTIMDAPTSTPIERLRAVSEILRCSDARVRWLGLAAPEKLQAQPLTRQELSRIEAQALPDDALEDELRSLGYVRVAEAAPLKDEGGATAAEPTVATQARAAARS